MTYKCELCGKEYMSGIEAIRHMHGVHGCSVTALEMKQILFDYMKMPFEFTFFVIYCILKLVALPFVWLDRRLR